MLIVWAVPRCEQIDLKTPSVMPKRNWGEGVPPLHHLLTSDTNTQSSHDHLERKYRPERNRLPLRHMNTIPSNCFWFIFVWETKSGDSFRDGFSGMVGRICCRGRVRDGV